MGPENMSKGIDSKYSTGIIMAIGSSVYVENSKE